LDIDQLAEGGPESTSSGCEGWGRSRFVANLLLLGPPRCHGSASELARCVTARVVELALGILLELGFLPLPPLTRPLLLPFLLKMWSQAGLWGLAWYAFHS
jgi:hypothetical protein